MPAKPAFKPNAHRSTAPGAAYPHGFMVLHGNRLEDLRDLLVQFVKAYPLAPLEPEVILLQSNGMKHWLELALADDDALGICAATQMVLPSAYLWQMYRAVLGAQAVPADMPFDKTALLWRLVRLLPILCESQEVYAPLKRYLGGDDAARKLYQLAAHIADVFDAYQSYRADWLSDWAAGRDRLGDAQTSAAAPLPQAQRWQAQLWRDLHADVLADADARAANGLADPAGQGIHAGAGASRAAVHARFMDAISAWVGASPAARGRRPAGVPQRLIVFGVSSLSAQAVQALAALGQVCQVMLFVQNPCRYYWGDLVEGHAALRAQVRRRQQVKPAALAAALATSAIGSAAEGVTDGVTVNATQATHPLLAALGKQARDFLHLLDGYDAPEQYSALWQRTDVFVDPATGSESSVNGAQATGATQLAQLQSAILNLNPPPAQPLPQSDDGSLIFVTAHSAQRELEVLHDRLLAWLDADATLQPRDVMVMVPDIATFAPHIHAVFGRFGAGQPRHIPYSVADTSVRQSALVQALAQLLQLPDSRLTLAEWLAFFEVSAVRARFGLSEADVRTVHDWLVAAGVRWGLDAAHRLAWGLPATAAGVAQNTWDFGLRRLLLGYALGVTAQDASGGALGDRQDGFWQGTLAQPAISGLDAPLAGALLAWVDALAQTLPTLSEPQSPAQWVSTLQALVARFFASDNAADERAIAQLLLPLDAWQRTCEQARCDTPLPLAVVREHWLAQLSEGGLHQRFFGGGVQFGTLMPMRAIPFKVICLLGLNDGDYPRVQAARDFDLMAQSWRAGDRSRREDDRYLFLEALLSARQIFYVSWQGRSALDNTARAPSVLVAQLLDVVNACWAPKRVPQEQPLQPFSQTYFTAGSGFETYAADWEPVWLSSPVNQAQNALENTASAAAVNRFDNLTLDNLQRLLRQPVEVFFRQRLQVEFDPLDDVAQEDEPFTLNHLEQHQLGQELLQAGGNAQALARLHAWGVLPLAGFGEQLGAALMTQAQTVLQAQMQWLQRYALPWPAHAIDLTIPCGGDADSAWRAGAADQPTTPTATLRITGTLTGLHGASAHANAPCLQLAARTGAVREGKGKHPPPRGHVLVKLWVKHLAGCASGLDLTSVQLGADGAVVLQPMPAAAACAVLARLADAYAQALIRPLPVACKTAWAFLQAERANAVLLAQGKPPKDPLEAARKVFETQPRASFPGEWEQSAYLQRAFDGFDDLVDGQPDGLPDRPQQGLRHWARVLYGDLFSAIDLDTEVQP